MVEQNNHDIGGRLKKLRMEKFRTQGLFAEAAGCSREHVNNVESNKSEPSLTHLKKMAAPLEMTTYELVKYLLNE